jgi:hypothetical protein
MRDTQPVDGCPLQPTIEKLTVDVATVVGDVNGLAVRYAEHRDKLADLEDLADLGGRVDKLEETLSQLAEKKAKGQRNWFRVKEADTAAKWLTELQEWLDTEFVYIAVRVPACWPWHPAAVADLLALQDHYNEAYKGSTAASVTDLWARALDATKKRLAEPEVLGRCAVDLAADEWVHKHCRDLGSGKKNIDAAGTTALIPTYAAWWVSGKDPAVEPQPVQQ